MRCERCAGLVVAEQFIGGATSNGGWVYTGGGVSIAVRLKKYSGNQARVLSYDIL
jgi:hypothetical protein